MQKESNSLHVLGGGFAAILLLLAASAFETFRLQTAGAPEQQAAYRPSCRRTRPSRPFADPFGREESTPGTTFSLTAAGQACRLVQVRDLERQGREALAVLRTFDPEVVKSLNLEAEFSAFLRELRGAPGSPKSCIETILVPRRLFLFADLRASQ
jgi:hypothetical protein